MGGLPRPALTPLPTTDASEGPATHTVDQNTDAGSSGVTREGPETSSGISPLEHPRRGRGESFSTSLENHPTGVNSERRTG